MKRYTAYLLLAALAVTACQRNLEPSKDSSDAIRFVASVTSPATRTVYTGDGTVGWEAVDWGDGGNNTGEVVAKERIEWLSGDRISIFCPNAADAKTASYAIEGETHEEGLPSSASTSVSAVTSGSALKWNNFATHYFFGRYPDPSWSGAPSEAAFTSQSQESSYFTCVIPASQTLTREGNSYTFNPDMGYCYMTAYAESKPGYDVALLFKPAVSAFEVAVPVGYLNGQVTSVKLVSSAHRLSGTYTVKIGNTPAYTINESSLSEADRTVAADLGAAVSVPNGETLVVTLFTCPVAVAGTDEDHLSVVITLSDNQVLTLPLKHGNTWYAYEPGNKYRITCGEVVSGEPVFTVNAQGHRVLFSPGNLQYIGSADTPYWKFADNQWDYLGDNGQAGDATNVDRDLLGWGTSGYNNKYPYMTSMNWADYGPAITYGEWTSDSFQWDWGVYNTISNGGGYSWRTPTSAEWHYILTGRTTGAYLNVKAQVHGTNGLILFPDEFTLPSGITIYSPSDTADHNDDEYIINTLSDDDWSALESAGCIFLPAAGYRYGANTGVQRNGIYWSSTARADNLSYTISFSSPIWFAPSVSDQNRSTGCSVRLVRDLN